MYTLKLPPTTPPSFAALSNSSHTETAIPVLATRSKQLSPKHASIKISPCALPRIRMRFSSRIAAGTETAARSVEADVSADVSCPSLAEVPGCDGIEEAGNMVSLAAPISRHLDADSRE